jgi:hypothetical protein
MRVKCKGCPFLHLTTAIGYEQALFNACTLRYTVNGDKTSDNCKLEKVQYTLIEDKNIIFIPEKEK